MNRLHAVQVHFCSELILRSPLAPASATLSRSGSRDSKDGSGTLSKTSSHDSQGSNGGGGVTVKLATSLSKVNS